MKKAYPKTNDGCILVGGGEIYPQDSEIAKNLGLEVICADGGVRNARGMGLSPSMVVGDLDSSGDLDLSGLDVVELADQNKNDFEKALETTAGGFVFCFGFWGKRLDHSLASLSVLAKARDQNVILFTEENICFRVPSKLRLELQNGDPIAFYPMSPSTAKSQGLAYPLDGLELSPITQISSSNHATGTVELVKVQGDLLVILPKEMLGIALAGLAS